MNIQLVIIDPQNDFCDPKKGTLAVPGADEDMKRLAAMIKRTKDKLDDIHVTLDSHHMLDISHPTMWKRVSDGAAPDPFTILGLDNGKIVKCDMDATGQKIPTTEEYTTVKFSFLPKVTKYLEDLDATGRYPHCIWPVHCLIGSWGACIVPELLDAIHEWEAQTAVTNYVTKGSNIFTEHFGAVKAQVPDPNDPTTQINTGLIQTLEEADIIALTGEALSHCLANTGIDIGGSFSDPKYIQKLTLLTDASSSVPGFEFLGDAFIKDMVAKGMKLSTTVDFLA